MKKIPTILATVTLVGGLGMGVFMPEVTAMSYVKSESVNTAVNNEDSIDVGMVKVHDISFKRQQVHFEPKLASGWYAKKVIISGLDYENGFTETDAEAGYESMGEEKADWELRFATYDLNGSTNSYLALQNGGFGANATKVLYYALLVGDGTMSDNGKLEWGEREAWIRGKIDYRSCAALEGFDMQTMYCVENESESLEDEITYVPYIISTGERLSVDMSKVKPWVQEWKEIQEKRLNDVREDMSGLERYLTMAVYKMDTADLTLDGLEKTLPKTAWADEGVLGQVRQLRQMVEYLRNYYNNINAGTANEADKKITQLEARIHELEVERGDRETLLSQSQERVAELERELIVREENVLEMREENERLKSEVERFQSELKVCSEAASGNAGNGNSSGNVDSDNGGSDVSSGENVNSDRADIVVGNDAVIGGDIDNETVPMVSVTGGASATSGQSYQNITPKAISEASEGRQVDEMDKMADADEKASDGLLEANGGSLQGASEEDNDMEGVKVPDLGVIGQRGWWWLLIPVLLGLGFLGLWLKRAFFMARTKE